MTTSAVAVAVPRWFTPLRLLAIFCGTNLFVYLDRGLIASNGVNGSPHTDSSPGSGIQGDFQLTYFQDGLLPAAFMVGLLLSAPFFAEVCKQYSGFRLLGWGMAVWSIACACCGLAPNYASLMAARAFVGVGEASFVALAAPFIDDAAPLKHKASWFAAFYLCIPVGFALGYIAGGLIAPSLGWRAAFLLEAAAMVPFVIFALTAEPLHLQGTQDAGGRLTAGGAKVSRSADGSADGSHPRDAPAAAAEPTLGHHLAVFWQDVRTVAAQPVWLLSCAAYTLYVAVMGVYAYWGPKAGKALFFAADGEGEQADLVFGGVTVVTGVLGSVAGGMLLDATGATLKNAILICAASMLLGLAVLLPAFLATHSFAAFMAAFGLGQFIIFILQAPVVAVQMWCVPQSLRALGASLMTVMIHLFGDVPSPPLLGLLQSRLSEGLDDRAAAEQWRVSMSLVTGLLLASAVFFALAARWTTHGSDFRTQDGSRTPLLSQAGPDGPADGCASDGDGAQAQRHRACAKLAHSAEASFRGVYASVWEAG